MFKRKDFPVGIVIFILSFIWNFLKRAYSAGRLLELVISCPLLVGSYFILCSPLSKAVWWVFLIPICIFSIYWHYLFQHEKVTSPDSRMCWADRDWWWELDGWEFEEEVAEIFRLNGYRAEVTKKTSDGGVDLILYKDKEKTIVQCKHYKNPVGVSVARELNGLKDDFRASKLILVASSGATNSALSFISNKPYFKILDLEDIIRMGLRPHYSS